MAINSRCRIPPSYIGKLTLNFKKTLPRSFNLYVVYVHILPAIFNCFLGAGANIIYRLILNHVVIKLISLYSVIKQ